MKTNRHTLSYVLVIAAIVLLLLLGLVGGEWLWAAVVAVACALAGLLFYRRGK
jgi:hypothetical protein